MHAYGHSRRDKLECKYGCCTTKSGKNKDCRVHVDRQNRSSARQSFRNEINAGLDEIWQDFFDLIEECSDFDYDERYDFYEFEQIEREKEEDESMYDTYDFDDYFSPSPYEDLCDFY